MGIDTRELVLVLAQLKVILEDDRSGRPIAAQLDDVCECVRRATGAERVSIDFLTDDPGVAPAPVPPGGRRVSLVIPGGHRCVPGVMALDLADGRDLDTVQSALVDVLVARAASLLRDAGRETVRAVEEARRGAVQDVVRASLQHLDLEDMLSAAVVALRRGTRCQGVWIRAFDSPDPASLRTYAASYPAWADSLATDELLDISGRAARICWEQQRVSLLHIEDPGVEPVTTPEERDFMFDFMRSIGARGILMAPLGGAGQCQGFIALTRTTVDEPFDAADETTALTIGRELGAAIVHARLWELERRRVEELQELDRYKSQFVATVAHQLKNPLTSILVHTELLDRTVDAGHALDRVATATSVASIKRGADRMFGTVNSLLTLSKVQDADRTLISGEVGIASLIHDCCTVLRDQGSAHGAHGAHGVHIDTRDVTPGIVAMGDRMELEAMVDNVIGNAVKYSPDGGSVTLKLYDEGHDLVFECADHGLGIAEEELARIFEPFHRSTNPHALAIPGTGLGMTIVKAVVDRHQGRITVESHPDTGTVVRVLLPKVRSG